MNTIELEIVAPVEAEDAAAKKAAAAPDREKLLAYCAALRAVTKPVLASREAAQVMHDGESMIGSAIRDLQTAATNL